MFRKIHVLSSLAWIALASTAAIGSANASTLSVTGTGSDGALAATATFDITSGQIIVTLTNDLSASSIRSVGQAVSDLSFNLSTTPTALGTASASGQEANISSTGVVTYTTGSPSHFIGQGGGSYTLVGNTITLEAIGGGQNDELIFPTIANGGTYGNTNPGVDAHNPYTVGTATFTLLVSGVTAGTTVTGATFSFGTGPDTFLSTGSNPPPPPVPEPSSLALFGTGVIGLAGIIRRRMVPTA